MNASKPRNTVKANPVRKRKRKLWTLAYIGKQVAIVASIVSLITAGYTLIKNRGEIARIKIESEARRHEVELLTKQLEEVSNRTKPVVLFLAAFESADPSANYYTDKDQYALKANELTQAGNTLTLQPILGIVHDIKQGSNSRVAEDINLWLRVEGGEVNTEDLKVDRLNGRDTDVIENSKWSLVHIEKHSPPAPLLLRNLKIVLPATVKGQTVNLIWRIGAAGMETSEGKVVLKLLA